MNTIQDGEGCGSCTNKYCAQGTRAQRRGCRPQKWVLEKFEDANRHTWEVWYCSLSCRNAMGRFVEGLESTIQFFVEQGTQPTVWHCTTCKSALYPTLFQQVGDLRFCTPRCTAAYDRLNDNVARAHNAKVMESITRESLLKQIEQVAESNDDDFIKAMGQALKRAGKSD